MTRLALVRCVLALFGAGVLVFGQATQRSGKYAVSLRLPPDGLFAGEEMEIELRVSDTSVTDPLMGFAPVVRAVVEAHIDMPEMPSMPRFVETAHAEGVPGDYGVHPTFAHGGAYRMRVKVTPLRDAAWEVEFPLLVSDAVDAARRKPRPQRFTMEIGSDPKRVKANEPVEVKFVFRDREQPKAAFTALEMVHEALFHLIVVRKDLSHFAHEHPQLEKDGSFRVKLRFPAAGEYRLFADIAPRNMGSQVLSGSITVSGAAGEHWDAAEAWKQRVARRVVNGTAFEMVAEVDRLPVRKSVPIALRITDSASGQAAPLEPYLGVAGHFLLVHQDGTTFVHSHPDEKQEAGSLRFLVRLPKPGLYRGWVQVKRDGAIVTADFLLRAEAP